MSDAAPTFTASAPVLVTGCAGFIGSHLAEALLAGGSRVFGIDCFNDNYGRPQKLRNLRHLTEWDQFEFLPLDLAQGSITDVVADCAVVFHLAAEPGVRSSWGNRYELYLRNNLLATQRLLEDLRQLPTRRLVVASSSSVYGNAAVRPTPETARLQPHSPYGQTKAAMEELCEVYQHNFGVFAVRLRYFTVYGPRQRPDMAFHRLCSAALAHRDFTIYGDGSQTRDFTYVDDIVTATLAAAAVDSGSERVFNVGGGSPASLRAVIDLLEEIAGHRLPVTYQANEHGDVRDTAANTDRLKSAIGFSPKVGLEEGLAREFDWLRGELAGPDALR